MCRQNLTTSSCTVSIVKYRQPIVSVQEAVEKAGGLPRLHPGARVIIKPNIVLWLKDVVFPKWGVITTSRIVEDMVICLNDHDVTNITIAEGMMSDPKDDTIPDEAFKYLGYHHLKERYGVKIVNILDRPFEKVSIDKEISLKFSADVLNSDYIVNIPVLKTHAQTVVSLGIKNLKGTIDIASRKKCHSRDTVKDLHYHISKLADPMPPMFSLLDGIFTNQRGPVFGGSIKRSNLLIASKDPLSCDLVGAKVLGWGGDKVSYLTMAAEDRHRPLDLSDIQIAGEDLDDVITPHAYDFESVQNQDGEWLPKTLQKAGVSGVSFRKYDNSLCTYCSALNIFMGQALYSAWINNPQPFDKVEILTGKEMVPTKGMHKTILVGKCMVKAHKDNPEINEMIPVKGCPAQLEDLKKAFEQAGIHADPNTFDLNHFMTGMMSTVFKNKPGFDERFFKVDPTK